MARSDFKIGTPSLTLVYGIFSALAGLVLPVFLIFPVWFLGHSEILEEVAKALVVIFLIFKMRGFKAQVLAGFLFGFLFGLSENFLYLNQIFQLGDMGVFAQRFLLTVPMHIATVLIMIFSAMREKRFLIFGFGGALFLHYFFNWAASVSL